MKNVITSFFIIMLFLTACVALAWYLPIRITLGLMLFELISIMLIFGKISIQRRDNESD